MEQPSAVFPQVCQVGVLAGRQLPSVDLHVLSLFLNCEAIIPVLSKA